MSELRAHWQNAASSFRSCHSIFIEISEDSCSLGIHATATQLRNVPDLTEDRNRNLHFLSTSGNSRTLSLQNFRIFEWECEKMKGTNYGELVQLIRP